MKLSLHNNLFNVSIMEADPKETNIGDEVAYGLLSRLHVEPLEGKEVWPPIRSITVAHHQRLLHQAIVPHKSRIQHSSDAGDHVVAVVHGLGIGQPVA